MPDRSPESKPEDIRTQTEKLPLSELRVESICEQMKRQFPEFPDMDREEYDSYNPIEDKTDRGQILKFYSERGKTTEDPVMMFIFKPAGFVVNYYNTASLKETPELGNNGDSVYGPMDTRWSDEQIDLALTKARIRFDGIDIESAEVQHTIELLNKSDIQTVDMSNIKLEAVRSILADKRMLPPVSHPVAGIDIDPNDEIAQGV